MNASVDLSTHHKTAIGLLDKANMPGFKKETVDIKGHQVTIRVDS